MIKRINTRRKDGDLYGPDTWDETVTKSLEALVIYELGYGGRITDISNTSVTVVTNVLGCVDTATFSGTKEEMDPLVEAAMFSTEVSLWNDKLPQAYKDRVLNTVVKFSSGNPLLIKMGGDIIIGGCNIQTMMLASLGEEVVPYLDRLSKVCNKTLFSVYSLVKVDRVPLASAMELL